MNALDVRTVLIGSILSTGICTLIFYSLWRRYRRRFRGFGLWLASAALIGSSLLLLSFRGSVSDFFSVFLSNLGVVVGLFMLYSGIEVHFGLSSSHVADVAVLAVFAALYAWNSVGSPDLRMRTAELSAALSYFLAKIAAVFLFRVERGKRKIARSAGLLFAMIFVFSAARFIVYIFFDPGKDFFHSDSLAAYALLANQFAYVAITFSLVNLVTKELEQQLEGDIRMRLEAENEARINEEKFSKAFHGIPDGLALTRTEDGTIIEINAAFSEMFGYTKEEAEGKTTVELGIWTAQALRDRFLEIFRSEGRVKNMYVDFRKKSGAIFPGYISAEQVRLRQDPCILNIVHDLSESREKEMALARSETLLNEVQNISHIGGWEYDVATSNLSWTDEVYSIHELTRGAYDPNDIRSDIAFYADSDREKIDEAFEKAILVGEPYDLELRLVTAKGNRKVVRTVGQPQYEDGKIVKIVGNIADITEKRQADEERRRVTEALDQSLNEIYMFEPKSFKFLYANSGAIGNCGYSMQDLRGMTPVDLKRDLGLEAFRELVSPLILGTKKKIVFESAHTRKDGTKYPVEVFLQLVGKGEAAVFLAIINDITERKKLEEEITSLNLDLEDRVKRRTDELLAANRELEAFSYSVSHDLRAPLRSIDGFSRAFLDDFGETVPEQGKHYLERVRKASQRMGSLIDAMLLLSRVTRDEIKIERVNLSSLAQEILAELSQSDPSRKVSARIEPGMEAMGDRKLLRILLDNLLGNAWKFSGRKESALIEFHRAADEVHGSFFVVSDNGAGFDQKYSDKLFVAFQRLHSLDEFSGTGIGLAIAQRVVRRHDGEIWAEGEAGKGASFSFTIPGAAGKT